MNNLPPGCHPDDIDGGLHPCFICENCEANVREFALDANGLCRDCRPELETCEHGVSTDIACAACDAEEEVAA